MWPGLHGRWTAGHVPKLIEKLCGAGWQPRRVVNPPKACPTEGREEGARRRRYGKCMPYELEPELGAGTGTGARRRRRHRASSTPRPTTGRARAGSPCRSRRPAGKYSEALAWAVVGRRLGRLDGGPAARPTGRQSDLVRSAPASGGTRPEQHQIQQWPHHGVKAPSSSAPFTQDGCLSPRHYGLAMVSRMTEASTTGRA